MFFGGKIDSRVRARALFAAASIATLAASMGQAEAQEKARGAIDLARAVRSVPERLAVVVAPPQAVTPIREIARPIVPIEASARPTSAPASLPGPGTGGEPVRIDPLDPRGADAVRAFGRRGEVSGAAKPSAPKGRSVADLVLKSTPIGAIVRGISIPTGSPSARALAIHEVRLKPTFGETAGYGFAASMPF